MLKVVLADDNIIDLESLCEVLQNIKNIELVATFSNGEDALEYIKSNPVDILVTDAQMPRMDGITLIENLRMLNFDTKVIMVSAYNDFDNAKRAIGLDVVDFVMKPVIDTELEDALIEAAKKCNVNVIEKDTYNQMLKKIKESEDFIKGQYIRNIIAGNIPSKEDLNFYNKLFDNLISDYVCVFIMKITDSDSEIRLAQTCIIIDEILKIQKPNISFFPTYMNEEEITVVAAGNDNELLINEIIDLRNEIISKYNVNMIVIISELSDGILKANRMYKDCKRRLDGIEQSGNKILICEAEDNAEYEDDTYLGDMYTSIVKMVYDNDVEKIRSFISKHLDGKNVQIRNFAYTYVNILEIMLAEINRSFDDIIEVKEVWKKLVDFESILSLQNFLENLSICVINVITPNIYRDDDKIEKVKSFIEKNYQRQISVDEIANNIGFSKRHLQRLFINNEGISIYEYLINYRIEKAKELLSGDTSIKDVAEKVGYSSSIYFSTVFKDKTGYTPKEYKKNNI